MLLICGQFLPCVLSLSCLCLVREQADGVLSFAAVLRGCLGQPTPPLCRYAEYTADPLLRLWYLIHRSISTTDCACGVVGDRPL